MSAEAIRRLEDRVTHLEGELERLRAQVKNGKGTDEPWWKSWIGSESDEESRKVHESIRLEREKDRRRTIRRIEQEEAAEKARAKKAPTKKKSRPIKSKG